jgi:hypothetical protein
MKKKLAIVVLALVMAGVFAGNCFATPVTGTWYICNVMGAGQANSTGAVCLTDINGTASFTNRWFNLGTTGTSGTTKQLLATSLTGSAAGLRVYANIPDISAGTKTINILYVVSDNF